MSMDKNVPEIRFKEFSGEWKEEEFASVVDIRSGRDYKHLGKGTIPVYGTGGYMLSVDAALSRDEDAIGIGRKGTINKPYLLHAPFWTVDTLFYAVPHDRFYLDFSYCLFQKVDWKRYDESTGVPSLSKAAINKVPVCVTYAPEEQKLLGIYFEKLDVLINQHQQKHDKLSNIKKSMLEKIFPKQGEAIPEIRFKGFKGDWNQEALGSIGDTYTGLSGKNKDDFGHGKGSFVTYVNVFSNTLSDETLIEPIEIDSNQNEVMTGDVFFTTSSETPEEVGMSSLWMSKKRNVYLNSFCFGFRPKQRLNNYFLAYMLRSSFFRNQIIFLAQGISRYNISKTKVMDIIVNIPDFEEQAKIGSYFKQLDEIINQHQQQINKLNNIKQACLNKMFV
jgi:type I restriction enzyme S subunit